MARLNIFGFTPTQKQLRVHAPQAPQLLCPWDSPLRAERDDGLERHLHDRGDLLGRQLGQLEQLVHIRRS